jgi:peptide/nickel transport system substrate-binding protein
MSTQRPPSTLRLFALLALFALLLAACGGAPAAAPEAPTAPAAEATAAPAAEATAAPAAEATAAPAAGTPLRGGTVRAACVAAITSLDPATSKLGICDNSVYNLLYNTLVDTNAAGEVLPELATEWTISDDGLVYTFTLREGVTFHDGTALDAEAVKFSFDRTRNPDSGAPAANALKVIDSIATPDAQTVAITLSAPSTPFLAQLGLSLNGSIVSPAAVEQLGEDFQTQAVGSGPFKFVSWTPGDKATFERFSGYWEQGEDGQALPYLERVELNGVPDEAVRLLNLQSGQFELNERNNPKDLATIEGDSNLQVLPPTGATSYQVLMNVTQPPFDNPALRQAVAAAIDREAIIKNVGFGTGYTAPFAFLKGAWFFLEEPGPSYDPELAKAKLAEAGYPDGVDVTLSIISRPIDQQIAQIVKANLDAVGIRTTLTPLERTAWVDMWSARQGQIGVFQRGVTATDPDDQSVFFDPTNFANFAGYDNPEAFAKINEARTLADRDERVALYREILALMVEDSPYVFIGQVPNTGSASAKVQGVELDPTTAWKLARTWISE